jgi:hypothetical protein
MSVSPAFPRLVVQARDSEGLEAVTVVDAKGCDRDEDEYEVGDDDGEGEEGEREDGAESEASAQGGGLADEGAAGMPYLKRARTDEP